MQVFITMVVKGKGKLEHLVVGQAVRNVELQMSADGVMTRQSGGGGCYELMLQTKTCCLISRPYN
jgi:hypothetical protein